jgi:hypothetical protein
MYAELMTKVLIHPLPNGLEVEVPFKTIHPLQQARY